MIKSAKEYEYQLTDPKLIDIYKTDKILIKENDLKYKNYNNIDLKRVKGSNIDKDTIEYRITECLEGNGITLDLSHLKLTSFPKLPKTLNNTLKYLFLSENNLQKIDDLSYLTELIVVDLCSNQLRHLPELPENIEELLISHNDINNISDLVEYDFLTRLDCSFNNIEVIPEMDSLEILICTRNNIKQIPKLKNIIKLVCSHNKIYNISESKYLEILDCNNNKLTFIGNFKNLRELYCSKNDIKTISNLNKVEVIHCYFTNVTKIDYIESLKELICDNRDDFILASHFTIISHDSYENKINVVKFK